MHHAFLHEYLAEGCEIMNNQLAYAHRERILALPSEAALAAWRDVAHRYPLFPRPPASAHLEVSQAFMERLDTWQISHAQIVLPICRGNSPAEIAALEGLVGRPITRPQPKVRGATVTGKNGGFRPRAADSRVITNVVPNPKKPGSASHIRFSRYVAGMTVDEALLAGVTSADIRWDVEHGFITVE
jgi:hypothetical protein